MEIANRNDYKELLNEKYGGKKLPWHEGITGKNTMKEGFKDLTVGDPLDIGIGISKIFGEP